MSPLATKIVPCIWFDDQAEEAVARYIKLLPKGRILATARYPLSFDNPVHKPRGSVSMIDFTLSGQRFTALNGGPSFKLNPCISLFLICEMAGEVELYNAELLNGGEALMRVGVYPWAPRYAWVQDRFGLSWQIMTGDGPEKDPFFATCLMFTGPQHGRATEAMQFYTSIFPGGRIDRVEHFLAAEGSPKEVKHGRFAIAGQNMVALDSPIEHDFNFNEALSFQVLCDDQTEIDRYWHALSDGGKEAPCGWLKDRFGVSWQIIPAAIFEWMGSTDTAASDRAFAAMLQMKKLDIAVLKRAFEGR